MSASATLSSPPVLRTSVSRSRSIVPRRMRTGRAGRGQPIAGLDVVREVILAAGLGPENNGGGERRRHRLERLADGIDRPERGALDPAPLGAQKSGGGVAMAEQGLAVGGEGRELA